MSTATTTTTLKTKATMPAHGVLPLKASLEPPLSHLTPSSSTEATLHSLYNRAAQAFLYRDIVLTTTLIASAFAILRPPMAPAPDTLDAHRRKWDILRITLESTVYAAPPDRAALPETLRELLLLSPPMFVTTSHARSLALFTPASSPHPPTSAFLPYQVLITLIGSSFKVDCPAAGREIIEDWLSNRGQYDYVPSTGDAYEKVLELYCLHVLPRLEEWGYAKEFLDHEVELPSTKRTEFQASINKALEEKAARAPPLPPSRSSSPTPSVSSSSSSLSTVSNRTAVPTTRPPKLSPRPRSASSTSITSDVTVTKSPPRRRTSRDASRSTPRTGSRTGGHAVVTTTTTTTGQSPGTLAFIKKSIRSYFTTHRLTTLAVLLLLLPMVSYIIRLRRTRVMSTPASTADQVKRRLFDARGASAVQRVWGEVGRAIWDTVRMGGGGLV